MQRQRLSQRLPYPRFGNNCFCWALAVLAAGMLMATPLIAVAQEGQGSNRPVNVVLIFADDLGWGDLACYGNATATTPHLDRMAEEGLRWTNFYSTCPYCAPSRASLLTGRYAPRCGVIRNPAPDAGIHDVGLPPSETTLGEVFQEQGYQTACFGKWHLGHRPEFYPTRHGFHEYLGILYSNDMRPVELIENETVVEYPVVQATLTQRYTDRALSFIERHRDQPFFLYLPHAMPHKPLAASETFYKESGQGLYHEVIQELDHAVGRILERLRELEIAERTVVIFTSDNGPSYGGSTGGLRGMKGSSWEGGIRVPMIVWWPKTIPAGHSIHAPAVTVDLFPTLLAAAGVPVPGHRVLDGQNLLATLLDPDAAADLPDRPIAAIRGGQLMSIRHGDWKFHGRAPRARARLEPGEPWVDRRAPDGVTIIAPFEQAHPSQYPGLYEPLQGTARSLYHLATDPGEHRNLASEYPDRVDALETVFNRLDAEFEQAIEAWDALSKQPAEDGVHASSRPLDWAPSAIAAQGDQTIVLPGYLASLHGRRIRYEPEPHKQTIGYWTVESDWAEWRFRVQRPGIYRMEILQGCGKGNGGSIVDVSCHETTLSFTVEETGHFQNFITRDIGRLEFRKPGVYTLSVRPRMKAANAVMDLRQIALRPVR